MDMVDLPDKRAGTGSETVVSIIDGFSHMVIHVTDLDRSEKFYVDAFGLEIVGRDLVIDDGPTSLLAMNTRQRILLVEVPEVTPIRPNSSSIHHAWLMTIDELNRCRERVENMGFDTTDSRAQFRAMGEYSMDVFDPDGHRYQVQAYAPESTAIICENTGPITCGNLDDFPVGTVKPFVKGKFFLVRLEDGFLALSRWCTHLNGMLAWKKEHFHFICPMHGARFGRSGIMQETSRPCPPMRLHPIHIDETGAVVVDPETTLLREDFLPDQLTPAEPGARTKSATAVAAPS